MLKSNNAKKERVKDDAPLTQKPVTEPVQSIATNSADQAIQAAKNSLTEQVVKKRGRPSKSATPQTQPQVPATQVQTQITEFDYKSEIEIYFGLIDQALSDSVAEKAGVKSEDLELKSDDLKEIAEKLNKPVNVILSRSMGGQVDPLYGAIGAVAGVVGTVYLGKAIAVRELKRAQAK